MHYSELGYDSYDKYLEGKEWAEIRDFFYQMKTPYRCRICFVKKKLRVHKRTYYSLEPAFFKRLERRFVKKILVYLCPRCNTLVHFYDGKHKKKPVPLDYVFLWDREQKIFYRPDMLIRRMLRALFYCLLWFRYSYRVEKTYHRQGLAYSRG